MNRFDCLMDDMKSAFTLCVDNKKIFLPAIFSALAFIVFIIIIAVVAFIFSIGFTAIIIASNGPRFSIVLIIAFIFLIFLLFLLLSICCQIGIVYSIKTVLDGGKVSFKVFFMGIKRYALRSIGASLLLNLILVIGFIILSIPLIIYTLTIGVLSAGWGLILLGLVYQALIGYWVVIMINNDDPALTSIGENLRFGKKNMKLMILILFLQTMLSSHLPQYFGFIGTFLSFLFIAVINTYMTSVIMLTYRRYRVNRIVE